MTGQEWDAVDAYDVQPLETLFERDSDRLSAMSLELGDSISTGRRLISTRICLAGS